MCLIWRTWSIRDTLHHRIFYPKNNDRFCQLFDFQRSRFFWLFNAKKYSFSMIVWNAGALFLAQRWIYQFCLRGHSLVPLGCDFPDKVSGKYNDDIFTQTTSTGRAGHFHTNYSLGSCSNDTAHSCISCNTKRGVEDRPTETAIIYST